MKAPDVPFLQVLDALYPLLGILYHLREQVSEGGAANLCCLGPVQGPVVDGLAVRGVSQAGRLLVATALAGLQIRHGSWGEQSIC
jgi:hypothetical protein